MSDALFGKRRPCPANWWAGELAGNCFESQEWEQLRNRAPILGGEPSTAFGLNCGAEVGVNEFVEGAKTSFWSTRFYCFLKLETISVDPWGSSRITQAGPLRQAAAHPVR